MKYKFGKTIVIALGGSIVFPEGIDPIRSSPPHGPSGARLRAGATSNGIDAVFLKQFKKFIEGYLRRGIKFVIVVGGGRLARVFQNAAQEVSALTDEDKDWIGIHSTRLNAHLLRTIFRKVADPVVFDSRGKIKKLRYPITIASGWRPGWSTDFVSAAIAYDFKISEFIVAGKPAFVYQKDPSLHKNAKSFEAISWKNYRKLIPARWVPGSHAPVDPVAAKLSDRAKIKAVIINGKNLKNFERLLNGTDFQGTIIG